MILTNNPLFLELLINYIWSMQDFVYKISSTLANQIFFNIFV